MKIIRSIPKMQKTALRLKGEGKRIAFVPTMGDFHEGHLSLIRAARKRGDVLVVSLFVNPAQFAPGEDFKRYPRNLKRDGRLARDLGADILFAPSPEDIYPEGFSTYVEEEKLSIGLCGARRPGHFRGVTTVVAKLFNIVRPDVAVFGQKDAQQARIIQKMVRDLRFPVKIVVRPLIRERDGLAMSSRNRYLSSRERKGALLLSRSLFEARERVRKGERSATKLKASIRRKLRAVPNSRIDYVEVVDAETLKPLKTVRGDVLIALAVWIGKARLIDNVRVKTQSTNYTNCKN